MVAGKRVDCTEDDFGETLSTEDNFGGKELPADGENSGAGAGGAGGDPVTTDVHVRLTQ